MPNDTTFADLVQQLTARFEEQLAENRYLSLEVARLGEQLASVRCDNVEIQENANRLSARNMESLRQVSTGENEKLVVDVPPTPPVDNHIYKEVAIPKSRGRLQIPMDSPSPVEQEEAEAATAMVDVLPTPHEDNHDSAKPSAPPSRVRTDVRLTGQQSMVFVQAETLKSRGCIIHPEKSSFMGVWDLITMPALLWVAFVTPVQVSVLEAQFDVVFVLSLCVDFIFVIDMILQFFTAYRVQVPGKVAGRVERRHSKIIMNYLTGWFPIELLTVIPFDLINLASGSGGVTQLQVIKVIRTLRLLKLFRIIKASRLFRRLEVAFPVPYRRLALAKFICILVLMCHWQASIWAMTLQISDPKEERWIDSVPRLDGRDLTKYPFDLYVASFYFCSYTMTSVGYGDIGAKNTLERIVCTMIVLVSGLCWAYILGEVCGIVADLNEEAQSFRKRMDNLNAMLTERGVPVWMQKRLRNFFLASRSRTEYMTQKELLQNMSSSLQGEVSLLLNSEWLAKVSFLKDILHEASRTATSSHAVAYRACIADIARAMDTMAFSQRETFVKVQRLHIVYKGLISVGGQVHGTGDVWGEDFILSDVTLTEVRRCLALTYAEIMYIDRGIFLALVEDHKFSCPQLHIKVRMQIVKLAARRGIVLEAKRRMKLETFERRPARTSVRGSENYGRSTAKPAWDSKTEVVAPNCISDD